MPMEKLKLYLCFIVQHSQMWFFNRDDLSHHSQHVLICRKRDVWRECGLLVMLSCHFKFPQKDEGVPQVAASASLCRAVAELLGYEQALLRGRDSQKILQS